LVGQKKYYLRFPYQDKIKVDPEKCEARLEQNGVLVCTFPIISIKNKDSGKIMRKKQKTSHSSTEEPSKTKPTKKDQLEKFPRKDQPDLETTMSLIDELNAEEDKKRNAKLDRSASREAFVNEKKQQKQDKAFRKQQVRQRAIAQAVIEQKAQKAEKKKEEAIQKKTLKRKISFSDNVEVLGNKKQKTESPKKSILKKSPPKTGKVRPIPKKPAFKGGSKRPTQKKGPYKRNKK